MQIAVKPALMALLGAAMCVLAPSLVAETPKNSPFLSSQAAQLSPDDMRAAGVAAVAAGRPDVALQMSDALLRRDPTDPDAQVIRARALRDLGRLPEAIEAARLAWTIADTPQRQYVAATVMAQSLSSNGNRTRAQFWLRRAAQVAPDDRAKAAAARDFSYVRSRNPLQLNLGFSVAPSSNINNGSIHASSELFGWPIEFDLHGTARALSGMEIAGQVSGRYRLHGTARRTDDITFQLQHTGYVLSRDAQDYLDEVANDPALTPQTRADAAATEASDFATTTVALGYAHSAISDALRGPYTLNASIGQTWYGGDPLIRFARVGVSQITPLDPRSRAHFGLSREWQQGMSGRSDARHWTARVGVDRMLSFGRVSLSLDHTRAASLSAQLDYSQTGLRLGLAMARPVAGMALEFGIGASEKHYPVSIHDPDGRRETRVSADVTATFRNIEFYGFSPSVTASYARTDANVALYERENFGLRLGVRSSF